jgi:hypothetical protein
MRLFEEFLQYLVSLRVVIRREFISQLARAMSDEMVKALEQERKARKLGSIPETVRAVLGEYFKTKTQC